MSLPEIGAPVFSSLPMRSPQRSHFYILVHILTTFCMMKEFLVLRATDSLTLPLFSFLSLTFSFAQERTLTFLRSFPFFRPPGIIFPRQLFHDLCKSLLFNTLPSPYRLCSSSCENSSPEPAPLILIRQWLRQQLWRVRRDTFFPVLIAPILFTRTTPPLTPPKSYGEDSFSDGTFPVFLPPSSFCHHHTPNCFFL